MNLLSCFLIYFLKYFTIIPCSHLSHIIIPFPLKQSSLVFENLLLWKLQKPCESRPLIPPNLIFYLSSNYEKQTIEFKLLEFVKSLHVSPCFAIVSVVSANLSVEEDTYFKGSRLMFEQVLKKNIFPPMQNISHIFYMEPDTIPIRSGWINALNAQIKESQNFWMKGSVYYGNSSSVKNLNPYSHIHINGNAIYNIANNNFIDYYFHKIRPFAKSHGTSEIPFDLFMFIFLFNQNGKNTKQYFKNFIFSDFIQNHWHSNYSLNTIKTQDKDTWFIHGGKNVDEH